MPTPQVAADALDLLLARANGSPTVVAEQLGISRQHLRNIIVRASPLPLEIVPRVVLLADKPRTYNIATLRPDYSGFHLAALMWQHGGERYFGRLRDLAGLRDFARTHGLEL
jgi:hypothetical protein